MIVLSNTTAQVVEPGQAITFNTVVLHTGNGECHRPGTSSVKMKANGIYEICFGGNIGTVTAGTAQISIALGGEILPETTMINRTVSAGDLNNVFGKTAVKNCCCDYDRITVINTGTASINVGASPSLFVKRVS